MAQIGLSATSNTGTDASVSLDGGTATSVTTAQNTAGGTVNVTNGQGQSVALHPQRWLVDRDHPRHPELFKPERGQLLSDLVDGHSHGSQRNPDRLVNGWTLGAVQNELSDISDNESVMVQNLQSSNSQIEDTNMASQMVSFTQDQTLVQAGISMLAQANQIPQYVLKLLG